MTGQKDRYTTFEKLIELGDKTLTTPKHDEIIIWSLDKNNILPLINFNNNKINPVLVLTLKNRSGDIEVKSNIFDHQNDSLNNNLKNGTHDHEYVNIIESHWDQIVEDYKIATSRLEYICNNWADFVKIESEMPIKANNGFIIGYLDIKISMDNIEKECGLFTIKIPFSQVENNYIEIKSYISSMGQTLRQIRTYQNHLPSGDFYLLTPDKKFKKVFESQGIKVLIYPNK